MRGWSRSRLALALHLLFEAAGAHQSCWDSEQRVAAGWHGRGRTLDRILCTSARAAASSPFASVASCARSRTGATASWCAA